jgi:ABC-2 type transport system permease protein
MVVDMKVFTKTLKEKYRGIAILSVLFFVFALYVVTLFPVMGEEMLGSFDEMFQHPALRAFGRSVSTLASIEGLLVVELYQWGIELLLGAYAVLFAVSFVSGEIEDKTIDVLLANPVSRTRILLEKYAALLIMLVIVNAVMFAGVIAGLVYIGEKTDIAWLVYTHILFMPFLLVVSSYSTFLSVAFDDTRRTTYVGLGILLGSFILNSVFLMTEKYSSLSRITLSHYFDPGKNLIFHEIVWGDVAVLCVVAAVLLAAAVVWFNRRDISVT